MCYRTVFCVPFWPAGNRVVQECTQGFESLSLRQTQKTLKRVSSVFWIKEEGIRRERPARRRAKNHPVNGFLVPRAGGGTAPVTPGIPFSPPNTEDTQKSVFCVFG